MSKSVLTGCELLGPLHCNWKCVSVFRCAQRERVFIEAALIYVVRSSFLAPNGHGTKLEPHQGIN